MSAELRARAERAEATVERLLGVVEAQARALAERAPAHNAGVMAAAAPVPPPEPPPVDEKEAADRAALERAIVLYAFGNPLQEATNRKLVRTWLAQGMKPARALERLTEGERPDLTTDEKE